MYVLEREKSQKDKEYSDLNEIELTIIKRFNEIFFANCSRHHAIFQCCFLYKLAIKQSIDHLVFKNLKRPYYNEKIFNILKDVEPFETILTSSMEKSYISEVKKHLELEGIDGLKIDIAVEDIRKANIGKTNVFIDHKSLYFALKANGAVKTTK